MGNKQSSARHPPSAPPKPPPEVPKKLEAWRPTAKPTFVESFHSLKKECGKYKEDELNICLIGHTGAGKSSLINSIYSISRNRIVDVVTTKSDKLPGVGTYQLISVNPAPEDILGNVRIFDTMGFTGTLGKDDTGITEDDIKAVCEGRVKSGHTFNKGEAATAECSKNKPHCIAFVVSAQALLDLTEDTDSIIRNKFQNLREFVPHDIAQIAIITKCDRICDDTYTDIENIYKSKEIERLVKRAEATFGMPQNKIFPIVNYVTESFPNEKKSLPILWAVYSAIDFAHDRKSMGVKNE